jgi:hypothetical protein
MVLGSACLGRVGLGEQSRVLFFFLLVLLLVLDQVASWPCYLPAGLAWLAVWSRCPQWDESTQAGKARQAGEHGMVV